MKEKKRISFIIPVIGVLILVTIVMGVSYAMFSATLQGTKTNTISAGAVTLSYTETNSGLTIDDAVPINDIDGKNQENYFDFSVSSTSTGTTTIGYYIYFEEISTTLANTNIKLYLASIPSLAAEIDNETEVVTPALASSFVTFNPTTKEYAASSNYRILTSNSFTFVSGIATPNIRYYRLKMWLDSNFTQDIVYDGTCSNIEYTTPDTCTNNGGTWNDTITNEHSIGTSSSSYSIKIHVLGVNGAPVNIVAP